MRVRWTVLLLIILLPFIAISIIVFDAVQLIRTRIAPHGFFVCWIVFYIILLFLIYIYPRYHHNLIATFYYWKIYIERIYPLFQLPTRYSIVSLTSSSIIFTGLVVVITQPTPQTGLIIITAFYASVLFFREIFSSDVPVLEMDGLSPVGG